MAEGTENKDPLKPKPRPIIRLGLFLVSYSFLVSVVCCTSGVLALLLLPILAKNTYISENALMPGSASTMLSNDDVLDANRFVNEIIGSSSETESTGIGIPSLIAQHIVDLGAEVNYHKFLPQLEKFHPLHFFSSPDSGTSLEHHNFSSYGVNTVGIIRAPRGDGKEAIVLVTPYNPAKITSGEVLSLGMAYSVFSLLTRVTWLAKDIIWLAADSHHGEYAAVAAWLKDYHTPTFGGRGSRDSDSASSKLNISPIKGKDVSYSLRRAGTMAAALVIRVADGVAEFDRDALSIYAEASNGQMPNLDLINIVNYLAVHGQGLRVKVEKLWSLLDSSLLKNLGGIFEAAGKMARSFNPKWNFGIPVPEYVEGTATLVSSLYNQALGIPTGSHGAFRDYQVDAITMEISRKLSSTYKSRQNEFLLRGGRLVEGVVRSINNLLEKFHQSFFLYLLTSPNKFVSVGVYMIAFALLVAPLPLVAASLFCDANKGNSDSEKNKPTPVAGDEAVITFKSWKWLNAAKVVLVVHLWGAVVALLPYFLCQAVDISPKTSLSIWFMISAVSLSVLHFVFGTPSSAGTTHKHQVAEWALLKSVTVAAAFIGLCLMSVINFATAEIGALLLVPMCLMAAPLRLKVYAKNMRNFIQGTISIVLVFVGFPPTAFFLLKGASNGFGIMSFGDFWNWMESIWAWNSATYIYVCMVHLPCWVLCIYTLLHH